MITEQELKSQCTPNIIKKIVLLAEGFNISDKSDPDIILTNGLYFPLLIHRAVEGWNKISDGKNNDILILRTEIWIDNIHKALKFINYQPENLTQLECALLHCMIEILKEEV